MADPGHSPAVFGLDEEFPIPLNVKKNSWGGGQAMKPAEPSHQMSVEKILGIKDQSCPVLRLSHKAMW